MLGVLFLALAAVGRLSGPFPYFAGIGDIVTGLFAIPLALRVARGEAASIAAWNAFGALDLFVAVGLGLTSGQGGPLQLLHVGVGSEAMQSLPFSLVPTVLVPFYLITHAVVAAQLVARRRARRDRGGVIAARRRKAARRRLSDPAIAKRSIRLSPLSGTPHRRDGSWRASSSPDRRPASA